jgi:hypothetical protein
MPDDDLKAELERLRAQLQQRQAELERMHAEMERLIAESGAWKDKFGTTPPPFQCGHFDGMSNRGWVVGHFAEGPLNTHALEVKWAWHDRGPAGSGWSNCKTATTLAVLIAGRFKIEFNGPFEKSVELNRPGDYVLFGPGVAHRSTAVTPSLFLTIRWPSNDKDCEPTEGQPATPANNPTPRNARSMQTLGDADDD